MGAAVNLGASSTNHTTVKGFIGASYTFPFMGFQNVSVFVGTSERLFTTLDIKQAEVVGGIRFKIPYMENL